MRDLISRQAVLKPYQTLDDSDTICIWLLRKNIEQTPSAQQWIPCSERMPKQNGFYLLSSSGTVLIAYYSDGEWLSELPLIMTENNTAWMPLPQPYKEGQNG